jgi:hypothetical protein
LRSQLGEANEGILAHDRYWSGHDLSTDENRLGPERLAETFLAHAREFARAASAQQAVATDRGMSSRARRNEQRFIVHTRRASHGTRGG